MSGRKKKKPVDPEPQEPTQEDPESEEPTNPSNETESEEDINNEEDSGSSDTAEDVRKMVEELTAETSQGQDRTEQGASTSICWRRPMERAIPQQPQTLRWHRAHRGVFALCRTLHEGRRGRARRLEPASRSTTARRCPASE